MSDISDYDRAISAYQFQVERYHTWMNYYSLFHGALLVALYSLENKSSNSYLPLIICLLGYIAGLCWLGTVVGNMNWIKNWINTIKKYESQSGIYSDSSKNIDKEKKYFSTQKIMRIFVICVCLSWIISASVLNIYSLILVAVILILSIYIYEYTSWIHS